MEKLYCRTFQLIMKLGIGLLPWPTPIVIEGEDSSLQIPSLLKEKGIKRVLLLTDPTIVKLGLINPLLQKAQESNIEVELFSEIEANPTDLNVEAAYQKYKNFKADALILFGGGAAMDCGKALAAKIAHPNKPIRKLQGLFKVLKKTPLMLAIPTTSGTGSETTMAAVITEAKTHHKASINDLCIVPNYAILDPKLTSSLPPFVTAMTGLDALSHAVEAFTNATYNSAYEDDLCKKAVKLIHENLYNAYLDGKNLEYRQNMQKAAFYAGRAFTRGSVGYVHALGHTFGGLYNLPHGVAMAILLPKVMRAYKEAVYPRLSELADLLNIQGNNEKEKALHFIEWTEDLNKCMQIPSSIQIEEKDIPQIVEWAHAEGNPLYPTPVTWSKEDFKKFVYQLKEEANEKM